ncbi:MULTISPECIES: hypothetical protein [Pseudomonadota]|uniref:hypothetical protein n=3 Tax=Pseudomonadota TaxID=1224 RepID=UPI000A960632|nr:MULTISPECIES: hypothetical protein [Pseudomonadota]
MATSSGPHCNSPPIWLNPQVMEVTEDPVGLSIYFGVPDGFFDHDQTAKDRALAAAGADLSTATIQTAAGWGTSASLLSITLEFLAEARESPVIGTGTITRMGTNVAFIHGQIMAGGQICLRATGSGRIENKGNKEHHPIEPRRGF